MKHKLLSIFIALVLALSLCLVTAVPAAAVDGEPTTTLSIPDNVYRPAPFDVSSTTTNSGTPYNNVRFDITVSGPEAFPDGTSRADIFTITALDGNPETEGINNTFELVGGDFVGYWGHVEGFPLPAGYTATSVFTIQMNDVTTTPLGNYSVTVALVDLTPDVDVTLASVTDGFSLSQTASVTNTNTGEGFNSIQYAIDALETIDGHTINVAAGEYVGAIVDKDLTIIGAADETSIITSGVPYTGFRLDADADGAEIRNFTMNGDYGNEYGNKFWFGVFARNADDVIVDSLALNDMVQGITNWGGSNWEITNNVIDDTYPTSGGGIAIYLGADPGDFPHCDNNLVQGNIITTSAEQKGSFTGAAICLWFDERMPDYMEPSTESMTGNEIIGNSITATGLENQVGIEIGVGGLDGDPVKVAACLGVIHDNTVTNNTIDNAEWGLNLYVTTNLTVQGNTVKNCSDCGIYMKDNHVNCLINYNNIYGNTTYGLNNTDGATYDTTVDATNNWWGDATGPKATTNPSATGNEVSDYVEYTPWLDAASPAGIARSYNVKNITTSVTYNSIQAAIDAASPDDTINVAAGTYAEHLTIAGKSNLTIQSTGDAKIVPTSTPWKTPIIKVDISTDITIRGLVIDGKNEVDPSSYSWGGTPTGVGILFKDSSGIIEGNEIRNFNLNSYPDGRRFRPVGTGIIVLYDCPQVTIKGNDIIIYHASGIRLCYGVAGNIINIIDNIITGRGPQSYYSGESIRIDAASTVNIIDNELSNNIYNDEYGAEGDAAGVTICGAHGGPPVVNITENDILNNTFGIIVEKAEGAVVEAHFNNIIGNGVHGTAPNRGGAATQDVLAGHGDPDVWPINTTLNATYNWWGDVTGPDHATLNTGAQGNAVSGNVLFSPWLYKAQENFISGAPCYAGSVVLGNEATQVGVEPVSYAGGWNTFSTPIALNDSADSISELLILAADSGLFIVRAHRFDPASPEEPLVALVMGNIPVSGAEDYQIKPGEGFFIQVRTKGSLPILCSMELSPPQSRELSLGWNLVGAPSYVSKAVEYGLVSLSAATVVNSPGANPASWSYPPAAAESKVLLPGRAYWVAMSADGTLMCFDGTQVADDLAWELNK